MHAQARAKARQLWARARPATNAHPYAVRKGINVYGLRQLRNMLLVPVRDMDGTLHSLQFIGADGSKRFLTGGHIAGCYYAIGRPEGALLIAEGVATASTLYQATGQATAACFSCGNIEAVARALRSKFPQLQLVICSDNDAATAGNPGVTKRASGGCGWWLPGGTHIRRSDTLTASPTSEGAGAALTDFNDLASVAGLAAVADAIGNAVPVAPATAAQVVSVDTWPDPITPGSQKTPEIPGDVLPGVWGESARAVAASTQTPLALAVMCSWACWRRCCNGALRWHPMAHLANTPSL